MDKQVNNPNKYIGARIRKRRQELSLSQKDLAMQLGVSYQQVQRYENGDNALAVEKLLQIAQILQINPDFFYKGVDIEYSDTKNSDPIIKGKPEGTVKILFIDDAEEDGILFRNATEDFSHPIEIIHLKDAESSLAYLETSYDRNIPHIIFLDINMPRIDGLELLKKIKKNSDIANIPVIMLTNSIREKEMIEAYKNHASGFIQKTTDFDAYCNDILKSLNYWIETVILPS